MKRALIAFLLVVALLAGAGLLAARYFQPTGAATEVPIVPVRRGEFLVKTYTRGDLRAVKSGVLTAPNIGGTLLITSLAPMGGSVKDKDLVLGFDSSEQEFLLATHQSELEEAEQEIRKIQAEAAIREQTDRVELMKAEFAVRRAELDVSRNELVSEIDAKKNLLTLEASRKRLAQLREDTRSRRQSSEAELAVAKEKNNKAQLDVRQAQQRIEQIMVRSPMSGLASVRQNRFAFPWVPGTDPPEFRVGDLVFGGTALLEVVDTQQMEVLGKVTETDRGNLREGQDVMIRLDALRRDAFPGKLKSLAGMTSRGFFSADPTKTFDAVFALTRQDPRLRPGMSGEVEIITDRVRDAVFVPMQAVFEKEGKKWVYVKAKGSFQRREVSPGRASESQVLIAKGLAGGEEVALVDPEARAAAAKRGKNPLGRGPMGR